MNKKVCVITGSSSGIGAASAILFSQRGWDVCVNYSKDPRPAEKVAALCRGHGADVLIERADVSRDEQCRELATRVKRHFGRCDALVNNAGTTKFVDLKDLDGIGAADFQNIYAVNVIGPFQMIRALRAAASKQRERRRCQRLVHRAFDRRRLEHCVYRVEGRPQRVEHWRWRERWGRRSG